jgi:hypothetical protein
MLREGRLFTEGYGKMKLKAVSGIMLTLFLVSALTITFNVAFGNASEPPAIEWNKTYGGIEGDLFWSGIKVSDGGYALAGCTWSFGVGGSDFWLVKVDSSGNIEWNKTYGGGSDDYAFSVVETSDGGYALAGYTGSFGAGDLDFWLLKTDSDGVMQWNRTYGGKNTDTAYSVIETSDGGYALAGHTYSFGAGAPFEADAWLVKTDSAGNIQWNRTYGGPNHEYISSIIETADGGYALAGHTYSFGAGDRDMWLVKVDATGVVQWSKTYGGRSEDFACSVVETADGYALAGATASLGMGDDDFWLVKTDVNGNMQWNRAYGGTNCDICHSLIETADGGYALAGQTFSFGAGDSDFWVVKTDSTGNMQWNRTYGGASWDGANFLVETSDGEYAIGGTTRSFGAGGDDFWLVKIAPFAPPPVGGIWVPVDKLSLLAPYIALASTILIATAATAIYVKRRKKQ